MKCNGRTLIFFLRPWSNSCVTLAHHLNPLLCTCDLCFLVYKQIMIQSSSLNCLQGKKSVWLLFVVVINTIRKQDLKGVEVVLELDYYFNSITRLFNVLNSGNWITIGHLSFPSHPRLHYFISHSPLFLLLLITEVLHLLTLYIST